MKITPTGSLVLVLPKEKEQVTEAGIVLADSSKEETKNQGTIIAIGNLVTAVKPDTTVVFRRYSGDEIEIGGKKHLLIDEDDLLAIID